MLSLNPIDPKTLPQDTQDPKYAQFIDSVLQAAAALVESLDGDEPRREFWSKGSLYNKPTCPTQSYSSRTTPPGTQSSPYRWHVRKSRHSAPSYDVWKRGLLVNHTENEKAYIESLKHVEQLQQIANGELELWRAAYHMAFPTSNRDFCFAICTRETSTTEGARTFMVISMPVDYPRQAGFTRAKYVSVEHVCEQDGEIVWTMATSSDAGGLVPRFVSELAMPSKIAEDVPSFLSWIKSRSG
ncbi:hypothetical protein OIV83_003645 [Microbotryomycetes sp. JL201]|nr:hypothetical protein OIV83_003645 [Microbotryomycetes sp. JL201]